MAIEIVPKPTPKISFSKNFLFYFSLILLVAVIFGYFILSSLISKTAAREQEVDAKLAQGRTPEEIALENEVKAAGEKIDTFARLIEKHIFPSKFLGFAEGAFSDTKKFSSLIHPQVQVLNFDLNLKGAKLGIKGVTDNFTTLEQQLLIFANEPLIKTVSLSSFSENSEGKLDFSFDLSFDPSIFK